jgi:integrase
MRREHGSGSVYRRASDGRWMGTYEDGWTAAGTRRRRTVSAKTEAAAKRKLRDALAAKKRGERADQSRVTVKAWAETYLAIRVTELAPKGYNAAANPIRRWVVPTIGHKRLADLTPEDVRAVAAAQRKKGRKPNDTHRAMMTMFRWAAGEGHQVPASVLATKSPKAGQSDRQSMTVEEGLACLEVASTMPHGTRWLFTLLYGSRQAECLGMTWDAIDLDQAEARIEWQLQALPYNEHRNRDSGFRLPDGYEARHLVDAYHLVRPKTRKGWRVAPLLPAVADALATWRHAAPDSPYGLVWPEPNGRPRNDKHDRTEWWELQKAAGVHHPTRTIKVDGKDEPAPYHVHECRSFAATMLFEAEVPEHVITDLLGHSSIVTSNRYRTVRREPMREAMEKVGRRLQLGG